MGLPRSRPSDTILDLLRAAGRRGHSARALVTAGELFGLTGNTVRVTLSRLVGRGLVESPTRGHYRLATRADGLNDFVERWRQGEARVRAWTPDAWLFAHLQGDVASNGWALTALGFREVRPGLHARPDNLALDLDGLRALGAGIGLSEETLLLAGRPQGSAAARWPRAWHPSELDDGYVETLERLRSSAGRLRQLPIDEARLESFRLGGEAIHRLAKDPLLPDELVDTRARAALWATMVEYEQLGRSMWAGAFHNADHAMPIPQLAAGG